MITACQNYLCYAHDLWIHGEQFAGITHLLQCGLELLPQGGLATATGPGRMTTPICWRNCSHNSIALQIWMQLSKQHMMSLPHDRNQGVNCWTTVQISACLLDDVARRYLHEIKTIIHITYTTTNQKVSIKNGTKSWMKEWNFEASFQP